ncbi:MAG: iron chaperone [Anaerolineales bacterium]
MNEEVQRFVDAVSDERRSLYDKLHALIMGMYPSAEVVISYGIPTYKAKSGRVGLGFWKGGVSLYTYGAHHLEGFREKYPAIKTSTGTINFKLSDAVPEAALRQVIKHSIEHPKPD